MLQNILNKLNEGGPLFMYTILVLLVIIIVLTAKGFMEQNREKTIKLISSFGFFSIAWGIMGQTIGLISAFDAIEAAGDISLPILAGGLKVSLLTTVFGLLTFLVSRLGIILLVWTDKLEQK